MYYFKDPLNPSPNMYDNARIIANSQLNEGRAEKDPVTGKWRIVGGGFHDRPGQGIGGLPNFLPPLGSKENSPQFKASTKTTTAGKLDPLGKLNPSSLLPSKSAFPMLQAAQNNQTDGETDEDIIGMRQTAADQGGIPQDLVNEPIERTKQLPDGSTIRSKTVQPPKVRPNIGGAGPMIPPKLPSTPNKSIFGSNLLSGGDPEIPDYENIIRTVEKYPTRMSSTKSKSGFYTQ